MVETEAILAASLQGLGPTCLPILLKTQKTLLPRAGVEADFQAGATTEGSAGNAGTPTHSASKGVASLPAYFTTLIKWQFRQSWVGLPASGLLIKLITMATRRERSHLPTPIFSHNSFNGCKSPKREAPLQHRAAATSLPPKQLTGRVHTQWDLQYENQSNLHSLTKATVEKQPSVRRLRHPSPPPPGGDALLRLPSVRVRHHRCQKRSAISWTRTFP